MNNENPDSDTSTVNIEGKENALPESFADLLEKSNALPSRLSPGQRVKAKVVCISGECVYIDLGGKSEGEVSLNEFTDEDGRTTLTEGDEVEVFFVTVQDGIRKFTTLVRGYSPATLQAIRDAHEAEMPVNGIVKREVKGGFEVTVGDVRCFCPFSQIDLRGGREGGVYLGQTFPFRVLEYKDNGRNVVLSRRTLLEQERQERVAQLRESFKEGMDVAGTIRSIQSFGAFIDLGGIDGLIPASEVSWDRGESVTNLLQVGQEVTARIISLDWDRNRLTLSLKMMRPDPWKAVADKYAVGSRINGTIVRLAQFGAFVSLEPGVDGLIHISNLGAGRRINHPKEVVTTGQPVEAYVVAVDPENRKISLSLQPKVEPKKIELPAVGELVDGVVDKVMPYGVFLKMPSGLTGLVPSSELGTKEGSDLKRMFPSGSAMQAMVIEVDTANKKVRLSRKSIMEKEVQEEFSEYVSSRQQVKATSGGLGSLGDILREKLGQV